MRRPLLLSALASVALATAPLAQSLAPTTGTSDLLGAVTGPIPPGTNVVGKVGIDQTTPGVTNAVQQADAVALTPFTCSDSSTCTGNAWLVDTTGFTSIDFQATSMGTGVTIQWQASDEPVCATATNWTNVNGRLAAFNGNTTTANNFAFTGANTIDVQGHCMRDVFTAYASGTVTLTGYLRSNRRVGTFINGGVSVFPIPGQGTHLSATASGTTGALSANFPSLTGFHFNWLCSFDVTSRGTVTATGGTITIGPFTGNVTYSYEYSTSSPNFERKFTPCLQGFGTAAITVNTPALGTGSVVSVNMSGFTE